MLSCSLSIGLEKNSKVIRSVGNPEECAKEFVLYSSKTWPGISGTIIFLFPVKLFFKTWLL